MGAWMRAWTCRGRPTYRHRVEGERSWLSLGRVKMLHKACLMLGLEVYLTMAAACSCPNCYAVQLMPFPCSQQYCPVRMPSKAGQSYAMAKLTARLGTCNRQPGCTAPPSHTTRV